MSDNSNKALCLDAFGALDKSHFLLRSCAMCYFYLFPGGPLPPVLKNEYLAYPFGTGQDNNSVVYEAKPSNEEICSTLSGDQCTRWKSCCQAAATCCDAQLAKSNRPDPAGNCEQRWDGYSCWDAAQAGKTVYGECPEFGDHFISTERSVKTCTENGTWFKKQDLEWTDYTPCLDREGHLTGVYVNIGCYIASIALLVPALIILSSFRELRMQHRVKLHLNLFMALCLCAVVHVLWYELVHHDVLTAEFGFKTVLYTNPVWCRVLSFSKIYLTSVTFMWMFCEGYYLHRLISQAFQPPKTLVPLYILGWGLPLLPSITYGIIRGVLNNTRCWTFSLGHFQWIIDGPNLIVLLVNLGFLCNIVRILVFQMHSHPHEPSNFRRGLKAAFMLIPLFGLQLILTMYRPDPGMTGIKYYEYLTFFVNGSQGFFVALIFCFCNGEVLSKLRKMCPCSCCESSQEKHKHANALHMTQIMTSADDCRMPPLHTKTPNGSMSSTPNMKYQNTENPLPSAIEMERLITENSNGNKNGSSNRVMLKRSK